MSALNDQIVHLYDTVFDRAPDAEGLAFWNAAADRGLPLHDMAEHFIASPEFADTYGQPTNRAFVLSMYQNVLDRPGEAGGVDYWTGQLDGGALDRATVVVGFSESQEHVARMAAAQAAADDETTLPETRPGAYETVGNPYNGQLEPKYFLGLGDGRTVVGGSGFDYMDAINDRNVVFWGQGGGDQLYGGPGDDTLHGGTGGDALSGKAGDDALFGGPGNDGLNGGAGNDALTGGAGDDVFSFRAGDGHDGITDLQRGDHLLFIGIAASDVGIVAAHGAPNPGESASSFAGYDVVYSVGSQQGTVHLDGIAYADLGWVQDSFLFGAG